MKVDAISKISYYNVKNSFKKNKMNNVTPSIANQNLTTPTLNQLQTYSKISFKGRKEILDFLNDTERLAKVKDDFSGKTLDEDTKKVFASKPDELAAFLLEERNIPILHLANSKQIQAFSEILDEKAPEVFAKALTIQNKYGNTPIHGADADKINAFKKALGDSAPEAFASALIIQNKYGNTPIHGASIDKINAFKEALGDSAPEVFAKALTIQNKDGNTPLHVTDVGKINAFKEALGDSAPEAFAKSLLIQNCDGDTPLHGADVGKINAFKEALGENTDKIFEKALLIENNDGLLAIYPALSICSFNKLEALIEVAPNATRKALMQKINNTTYIDCWQNKLK